ncbi:MAG: hypothetical protein WA815_08910, partial [Terracidiphilus sp.]
WILGERELCGQGKNHQAHGTRGSASQVEPYSAIKPHAHTILGPGRDFTDSQRRWADDLLQS